MLHRLPGAWLCALLFALIATPAAAFKLEQTPGALSRTVVPIEYKIEIEADPYATSFAGRQTIRFEVRKPTREILLHADGLAVQATALDGRSRDLTVETDAQAQTATVRLPAMLERGVHTLSLAWQGKLEENEEGLYVARYRTPDGAIKRMLATQMEPVGARRMLPLFDEPAFRARFDLSITTPARFTVLSNMPQASEKLLDDGRKRVRFVPTPKMASYLLALAVGEFEATRARHDGIELAIWSTEGRAADAGYALDATKSILDYFHAYFGSRYPLPKLDQIAVPGKQGAMENWGLITYGEELLLLDPVRVSQKQQQGAFITIAHEIAHQWFGNLVTMAWWDDLWLNEAFAEWMGVKAALTLNPPWQAGATLVKEREEAMAADALVTARPIARTVLSDAAAFDSFDSATYNKGHMVIGLLEQYLGEVAWRDGIRAHLAKHAYSNASGADFWSTLARTSGKPVGGFAQAWTKRPGHPIVFAEQVCEDGQAKLSLRQLRYGFGAVAAAPDSWPLPLRFAGREGEPAQTIELGDAPASLSAPSCKPGLTLEPAPFDLWRVAWDDASLHALLSRFALLSSEQRARLLGDAWALAQTGDVRFETVVAMLDALPVSDTPQAWSVALSVMSEVKHLAQGTPQAASWDARIRGWLAPVAERLTALPADQRAQAAFSTLASDALILLGRAGDPAVLALAQQQFALTSPTVERDLYYGLLRVLAARGSAAEFDAVLARFRSNADPAMNWAYGRAVAQARTPEAVSAVLALTLGDEIARNVRGELAGWLAYNGNGPAVWAFTLEKRDALFARAPAWSRRYILANPLEGTRDPELAAQVLAYARAQLQAEDLPTIEQAVAEVERLALAWQRIAAALEAQREPGELSASAVQP
ncbi:M1 family metallopeptidase [Niveibacterium sp. 24ML]|uniref:M1 family metallopeptidase n=1 Tax=Niveibacterium sp. 24ML TaxID=2985512 RepID=UPI00226D9365|nr:M1 family metallopeptidase [Niveibacterium sp. 24ML]MCX9155549.1 M1 family metallopeptidase [Niveibacterium sp. 24ML]